MKYIKIRKLLTTFIFLFVLHQSYSQPHNSRTENSIDYDNKPIPVEIQIDPDYDITEQNNATDSCLQDGFFQCYNGHQCIDAQNTCDGITQCSDGSDEWYELCGSNSATTRSTIISTAVIPTFTKSDETEPYDASASVIISQTTKSSEKSTTENILTASETTDVPVYASTIVVETHKSSHYNWLHLIIIFSVVVLLILVLSIIVIVFLCKGISQKTGVYNL